MPAAWDALCCAGGMPCRVQGCRHRARHSDHGVGAMCKIQLYILVQCSPVICTCPLVPTDSETLQHRPWALLLTCHEALLSHVDGVAPCRALQPSRDARCTGCGYMESEPLHLT